MGKSYKAYDRDRRFSCLPRYGSGFPRTTLPIFVADVVDALDLSKIEERYGSDERGQPPYHPAMMVALLFYAYCVGTPSSRKIERKTYEDITFRVLAAGHHPDHDTIASFRKAHLHAVKGLFLQILLLCQEAKLVEVGHISRDGTQMKANASKHKAMSYERMCRREKELQQEIEALLAQPETTDHEEDRRYGKGHPTPNPKDQINFTDAESRIMKDSATKEFIQG